MIINPQIDIREIFRCGQHQGRGLPAALVTACSLTCVECGDQAFRQRKARISTEAIETGLHHSPAREHIPGHTKAIPADMPTPFNAIIAGPGRIAAMAINGVNLAQAFPFITYQRGFNGLGWRQPTLQALQYRRAKVAVAHGLGADGANAGFKERAGGAHSQIAGGHGHGEGTGRGIMRNNGPGHGECLVERIKPQSSHQPTLAGSPHRAKIERNGRFLAMSISISRRSLAGIGLASLLPSAASAQSAWPDRQVRLIVPFGAGGAVDTLSRLVANGFAAQANGQAMVVENRSGAGGAIAGAFVAQSRPDGYTLMMADLGANCIGKELQPALNYDPMRAFTPVSHLVNLPIAVIVPANLPVQNLEELMARARARADGIQYASPGVGHVSHLAAELLGRRAGVKLTAVHYRSGADVMRSLIQGETEFSFPSVSTALPFIREGRVRALAIGTPAPVAALPGVPSVAASFPGFEAMTWHGIVGPAGMPDDVVAAANRVFRSIITSTEVKETVQRVQAAEVIASSPAEFAALLTRDHAKWTPVIREGNIRAE